MKTPGFWEVVDGLPASESMNTSKGNWKGEGGGEGGISPTSLPTHAIQ